MTIEQLEEAVKNMNTGLSGMPENGTVLFSKSVIESVRDNYLELIEFRKEKSLIGE